MRVRPRAWVRWAMMVVLALGVSANPARAEDEKPPFTEPGIDFVTPQTAYIQWIAGTLIILACTFVAIKNPHRSHMD